MPDPSDVLLLENVSVTQITSKTIAIATKKDPVLSRVFSWVLSSWPPKIDEETIKPCFIRRNELSVINAVFCGVQSHKSFNSPMRSF